MTKTEIKNLLQLLCSEDVGGILLAIQILQSFEDIPHCVQFVVGLRCFPKDEEIALPAKFLLEKFMNSENFIALMDSLVVFIKAERFTQHQIMWYHPTYHRQSDIEYLQKYKDSHKLYTSYIPLHSYVLNAYLRAGFFWTYESKVNSTKTRLFFEAVLQFYPNHPYALFCLGYHYRCNQSEPQKSIEYYQKFLKCHLNLTPNDEMERLYRSAIFSDVDLPTTFNAYQHLAYLYQHQLKDFSKAIYYYWKAKYQSPKNTTFAYCFLAQLVWTHQGDSKRALEVAEEGLEVLNQNKYPTDRLFSGLILKELNQKMDLHHLLGNLYAGEIKDKKQALGHYEQALKLNPQMISVHLKCIRLSFEDFKDYPQTEEFCLRALKYAPKNSEIMWYLKEVRKHPAIIEDKP